MVEDQRKRPRAKYPTIVVAVVAAMLILYGVFATNWFFG
jgi:hypothetical protein